MLASGLKGMDKKYKLAAPIEENIFHMNKAQIKKNKIDVLPNSLENAFREAEKSELLKEALGEHIFSSLIANKRVEWDQYRMHISRYELDKYLPML